MLCLNYSDFARSKIHATRYTDAMNYLSRSLLLHCLALLLLVCLGVVLPMPSFAQLSSEQSSGVSSVQSVGAPSFDLQLSASEEAFLPVEKAYGLLVERSGTQLRLDWSIADTYYLYKSRTSAQLFVPDGGRQDLVLSLPTGKAKHDEFFGDVEVFYYQLAATAELPSADVVGLLVTSQGCAEAGLCYPPYRQYFLPDENDELVEVERTVFMTATEGRGSLPAEGSQFAEGSLPAEGSLSAKGSLPAKGSTSLLLMVLFAFVGGLILNLMPCVFPILALKILGLVNASAISPTEQKRHGLAYSFGVVLCFLLVAVVLISLRAAGEQLGWGFQLQTPWLVASLAYLFFVLALSMSGHIEVGGSWSGLGQSLVQKQGLSGSFFTGILAVLVASPCTAPFMGAALGFALVQPAIPALAIFVALGVGMAAPFLLFVSVPRLAKTLPKPGAWMVRFREFMAFPLYLTAVWLAWVVGRQLGVNAMALITAGCVFLFLALWLWRQPAVLYRGLAILAVLVAMAMIVGLQQSRPLDKGSNETLSSYSPEKVTALRGQGKAVFVNLTADWCITCIANERVALSKESVLEAFNRNNVAYLVGDWTNSDHQITQLLGEYQRSGVPLYLLYAADSEEKAQVLPQLLTPRIVIDALEAL